MNSDEKATELKLLAANAIEIDKERHTLLREIVVAMIPPAVFEELRELSPEEIEKGEAHEVVDNWCRSVMWRWNDREDIAEDERQSMLQYLLDELADDPKASYYDEVENCKVFDKFFDDLVFGLMIGAGAPDLKPVPESDEPAKPRKSMPRPSDKLVE